MRKRSHRHEKMARVYDEEILPIWSQRFGRMLLRGLELPPKAMVLDVNCATGYPALEILKRMDGQGRIIAIDPIGPLLDVARRKAGPLAGRRVFFRSEAPTGRLAFADDVYDLVVSNLGLLVMEEPRRALREFARVTKPGGRVIVTLPLAGTYAEFFDIYREVLTKADRNDILERLEAHIALLPEADEAIGWMEEAGLAATELEVEEFRLLFMSSREFFFAPVIEFGPLAAWKDVAGKGEEMQEVFWRIKQAIDAYFGGRAFELTVKSGCLRGTKITVSAEQEGESRPSSSEEARREQTVSARQEQTVSARRRADGENEAAEPPVRDNFKLDEDDDSRV